MIANHDKPSNLIIQIHVMKSDSLVACTCSDLYYSAEPLPMSFILPQVRLVNDHLRTLSYQRPGPPATLTTWTSLLYVTLTNSLKCQDAALLESLFHYIHYNNTTIKSLLETHGITWSTYYVYILTQAQQISVSLHHIKHTWHHTSCFKG